MAAKATEALGKGLNDLKVEYDRLQNHLEAVEKSYQNLLTDRNEDGELPVSTRLQLLASQLFNNAMFSDITILLQGGEDVKAHKFVLSASGYDWGVNEFDKVDMLDLTDMRYEVCYAMIKWVYTDEFDFHHKINDDFLIELMQAAKICKLESLFIRCQKALSSITNNQNCEKFLKISEELGSTLLNEHCIQFLQQRQMADEKQKVVKPELVTVKIHPTLQKDHSGYTSSKSKLTDQKTPDNIKIISIPKQLNETIHKSEDTAESILQENSTLQIQPLADKGQVSVENITVVAEDVNSLPMVIKIETDTVEFFEAADEEDDSEDLGTTSTNTDPQQQDSKSKVENDTKPSQVESPVNEEEQQEYRDTENSSKHSQTSDSIKKSNDETFICDVCNKSFKSNSSLKRHKVIHEAFKPHQCPDCQKTYHHRADLLTHMKTHNKELYQCDECGKCLRTSNGLEIHKTTHVAHTGIKCKVCGKVLRNKTNLINHMHIHSGEKKFKCDVCNKSFTQEGTLRVHRKTHSQDKPFTCDVCNKSFRANHILQRHKAVHTKGKRFQCNKCGKAFRFRMSLNKHYATHDDIYRCDFCNKILLSVEEYQNHKKTHLAPGEPPGLPTKKVVYHNKPYCCDVCGKDMRKKAVLEAHMRIHTGERPFVCYVCNKTFRTKELHAEHLTIHTGELPNVCEICGKAFRLYSTMHAHLKTHNTELSFTCDICGKSFTTANYLKKHKESHNPVKPFKCDVCNMGFRNASARNQHRKNHDVIDRGGHECPYCHKKGFKSISWFNSHKKKCRETPRFCAECGIHYSRSHTYKHHTEKYGNVNPHYHCTKCIQVFTDLQTLHHHDCIPRERISCPYCPALVVDRLQRHLECCHPEKIDPQGTHLLTKEQRKAMTEKFACPLCDVQIMSISSLRRHIKMQHKDVQVAKVTRKSVSIVPGSNTMESHEKIDQEIVTQEVLDWNTFFPETQ